jgi:hypothetical protein
MVSRGGQKVRPLDGSVSIRPGEPWQVDGIGTQARIALASGAQVG